jgi:hypothetical protein
VHSAIKVLALTLHPEHSESHLEMKKNLSSSTSTSETVRYKNHKNFDPLCNWSFLLLKANYAEKIQDFPIYLQPE